MIEACFKFVCLFFSVTLEEQIILICRSKPLETIKCYFTPETLYRQYSGKLIVSSTLNNYYMAALFLIIQRISVLNSHN